ncbi:MAG: hypothetical protein K8H88_32090, partial [Sandaracinaceae bacterium]|nr:hypothetical protein [Sandaracinaceae bacterium]
MTTEGHVFISAHKDVASSTATMQAKGYVHIQSQDSQVWISGKQGAFLHASEQVVLNGGKGLLIGSGAMMDAPTNVEPDGADPKVPAWLEGSRQLASKTANMWGLIDMYAGGLEHALQVSDAALAIKHKQWADLLWILFQATITQLGSGVVKDNIMGGSMMPDKTDGSTIVYGDGGLVLGSGGSAGIYAKYGCSLSSLTFAGITAPWASLTGLRTVELRSVMKGMSLASGEEMQQVAKKSVEIASRSERVALKGKQLVLGSKSGAQQAETEVLAGYAQKAIGLASKGQMRLSSPNLGLSADNAVVNAKKLALNGKDKATLSGKEVAIKGGSTVSVSTDAYFLNIDGSSIKLGNVAKEIPAEPTPKPPDYEARIKLLAEDAPNAA